MPTSKRKNAAKARVFNNLKRNFSEQPREVESIGKTISRNLATERQTNNEMDDATVDNDISVFNDAICFIRFVFNNMLRPSK